MNLFFFFFYNRRLSNLKVSGELQVGLKESMNSLMSYAKYLMYVGRFFFSVNYPFF